MWLSVYELSREFHEGFVFVTVLAWSVSMGGEVKSSRGTCQCMQLSCCCLKLWSKSPSLRFFFFFYFLSWSLFSLWSLHNHDFFFLYPKFLQCNSHEKKLKSVLS